MKGFPRQVVLWLGSAIIAVLAVPATVLIAMIYGVSALVDRLVGKENCTA